MRQIRMCITFGTGLRGGGCNASRLALAGASINLGLRVAIVVLQSVCIASCGDAGLCCSPFACGFFDSTTAHAWPYGGQAAVLNKA